MSEEKTENTPAKKFVTPMAVVFFAMILGIAIFTGVRYNNAQHSAQTAAQEQGTPRIVVLNTPALIAASTKQIMDNKSLSNDQVSKLSSEVASNMRKVVEYYRDQGYIVLNGANIVTWPKTVDITATVAQELGIKL